MKLAEREPVAKREKVVYVERSHGHFGVVITVLITIVLAAALVFAGFKLKESYETIETLTKEIKMAPQLSNITIEQALAPLADLTTQEYVYRNADRKDSSETWIFGWERPFSSKSILISYDGVIKAGIDFSEIDVSVNDVTKIVTVDLPESRVTDNSIPQESITVLEVKNGLFNEVTFDDYNEFIAEQKEVMEAKAIEQGLLEKADEEAKLLVKAFVSELPGMENYQLIVK